MDDERKEAPETSQKISGEKGLIYHKPSWRPGISLLVDTTRWRIGTWSDPARRSASSMKTFKHGASDAYF
jgi:hypothetical protein